MTKKRYEEVISAMRRGNLFDYIADNAYDMDKADLALIAKELAYACSQPLNPNDRMSRSEIADVFTQYVKEYNEAFGFDEEDE